MFKSNDNIFETLFPMVSASVSAICLLAFSVILEILTPCSWSKPLSWLFEFASCFSHSLSVPYAAIKLTKLFTVILSVRINKRFWFSRYMTRFFCLFWHISPCPWYSVLRPREVNIFFCICKSLYFFPQIFHHSWLF